MENSKVRQLKNSHQKSQGMMNALTAFSKVPYIFAFLGILFIPFTFHLTTINQEIIAFLFEKPLAFFAINILNINNYYPSISSDSTTMYLLVGFLIILSLFLSFVFLFLKKWRTSNDKIIPFFNRLIAYYLALILLKYGFDKIFKAQFYLPEPNTLYTPLGQLDKDILYWSSMGTSYSYSVFAGGLEVFAAILLLFKKTRTLGVLITIGILTNVVAINFSFDISVKIYALFLLFLACLLITPQIKTLYQFFILQKSVNLKPLSYPISTFPFLKTIIKTFVLGLFLLETVYPYLKQQNFNDDNQKRPYLHGAYEVQSMTNETDTIPFHKIPIQRIFIHRRGYLIFQNPKDEFSDYELTIFRHKNQFQITDYQQRQLNLNYQYVEQDSILQLEYRFNNQNYFLKAKALNWRDLPVLQHHFHWQVD